MKKRYLNSGIILVLVVLIGIAIPYGINLVGKNGKNGEITVVIAEIVEIPPIQKLREGFKEQLVKVLTGKKISFSEYNAQGDSTLINQIVDKIVIDGPDLVYALGTPIAQAIQKRAPDLYMVQGAATDPIAAGLADSWDGSGRRYAATSDLPPVDRIVQLIRSLLPGATRVGIIYNPGESNSIAVIDRLKRAARDLSPPLSIIEAPIGSTRDVPGATDTLIGRVDVLFLPPDNTAAAAMDIIGRIALDRKTAFIGTEVSVLDAGAVAVVSVDFTTLGREAATIGAKILMGDNPATIPIQLPQSPTVYVNKSIVARLGLTTTEVERQFPQAVWR